MVCKPDRSETQFRLELPTQIRGKQIRVRTGRNWVTLEGITKPGKTTRSQRQGGKKSYEHTNTQFTRFYNPSAPSFGESVVFPTKNQIGFVCCKFSGFPQILGSGMFGNVFPQKILPPKPSQFWGCFLFSYFLPCLVEVACCSLRVMSVF